MFIQIPGMKGDFLFYSKQQTMKNTIYFTVLTCLAFLSCQKKDVDGFDSKNLNITISKPVEAQMFKKGDTIFIKGNIAYISQLHGYSIKLSNKETKESYLDKEEHLHDSSFEINSFWVDTLSKNADLLLEITVEADHDGHEQTKNISLISKP